MSGLRAILAAAALACALPAAAEPMPIVIGETHRLAYARGDEREVNVFLPAEYAEGAQRYPVLYLIDGGLGQDFLHIAGTSALNALWGRSQPVIVVGIETRDRRAELIGSPGTAEEHAAYPTAGNSARFRAFLRDAVKPLIEAHYRTNGEDGVIGESLAGLFIVETWLAEPALFDRYAAIDASLWWDEQKLGRSAMDRLADGKARGPLYLTYSNEGPETELGAEMVAKAGGGGVCFAPRPDLTHATAYHVLTPQALQFLFPPAEEAPEEWGFVTGCPQ